MEAIAAVRSQTVPTDLANRLASDLEQLRALAGEINDLDRRREAIGGICCRLEAQDRKYCTPAEEEQLGQYLAACLSGHRRLLHVVAAYRNCDAVAEGPTRNRCFLLYCAAALMARRIELQAVGAPCGEDGHRELMRRKLNEARRDCGLPAGTFDDLCRAAADLPSRWACESAARRFERRPSDPSAPSGWTADDCRWLEREILAAWAYVQAHEADGARAWSGALAAGAAEAAYAPFHAMQAGAVLLVGWTNLPRANCVSADQVRQVREALRPGDIVLIRRFGHLSNAWIPGFWTHAMIYAGTDDDLRSLGIADEPAVRRGRDARGKSPTGDAEPGVIESTAAGVAFKPLSEALAADWVLALRPRFRDGQAARAIERAFSLCGTPYDFDFDAFTADRLTCSELVYRVYGDLLDMKPRRMYGRDMFVSDDLVATFLSRRHDPASPLEAVLLLIGDVSAGTARFAGAEEIPLLRAP